MSKTPIKDYDEIIEVVNKYIEGLVSGEIEVAKQAFHKDAVMYGYNTQDGFLGGTIDNLWDFMEKAGPAKDLKSRVDILDVEGTIASVRVSLEKDAYGESYTDFHQLLKTDGKWNIISKLFHLHA
ncbi:nuclear transport factor 2 family protein [Priestia endophytica]|uniref:nuclear transport factor 2 family protein n=1 Tax=Priestia endophytica TaxID=135735 RepID=UPI000DCA45CE|nr:nuclear transport factor 2 family protein [Priestia endophytica]RAS85828.1 hypothetical protein A4U60_08980 [Priestia endophytica]